MEELTRPHFMKCKESSDHGHIVVPNSGTTSPLYCKTHALEAVTNLINDEIIDSAYRMALLQDINACSLPNTETPYVQKKIKKVKKILTFMKQAEEQVSSLHSNGYCSN